jgi:serine/threonine protein kinase
MEEGRRGEGSLAVGDTLGPYRLEALLGEGAVGVVFRAVRIPEGTPVALKVMKSALSADETYRRRFAHEARAAAAIQHHHLVPVLDAGEADGFSYLATRYVPGRTLEKRLEADGPLVLEELVRLLSEVGAGLDALHRDGLIHRDVKPSNVLLDEEGGAALTDFGLAKGQAYTVLTRPGQVIGTLDYLAPEVFMGNEAAPAADIYALGCVAFECLAGEPPFAGRGIMQIASAHLGEEPPDPCAGRPGVPSHLSWALLQALAKEPEQRPPTATAYAHMVRLAARSTGG